MPIYEFRCADCGRITNHFTRKIDTEVKAPCEHSGDGAVCQESGRWPLLLYPATGGLRVSFSTSSAGLRWSRSI